jgi:hypothetical protein
MPCAPVVTAVSVLSFTLFGNRRLLITCNQVARSWHVDVRLAGAVVPRASGGMVSLVTIQPANRQSERSNEMDTEKLTLIAAVLCGIVQQSSGDTYHQQRHTIE